MDAIEILKDASSQQTFKPETVQKMFELNWESKTKIAPQASKLAAEFMRAFVIAAHRATSIACAEEHTVEIEPEHLEKALPQLLLDF
eukprot:m.51406 g.51406  ORF g.51406 m.51406 type:complete len:87 (-) comp21440_c0_seq1:77-337(-)